MDKTCWNKTPKSIQCFNWRMQALFTLVYLCLARFIQTKNGRKLAVFPGVFEIVCSWVNNECCSFPLKNNTTCSANPALLSFSVLSNIAFTHPMKKMRPPFYNYFFSSSFKPSSSLAEWHFEDIASPPPSCPVISHNYPTRTWGSELRLHTQWRGDRHWL